MNPALIALHIVKKKSEKCLNEKNVKTTKWSQDYKGYASTDKVKILNSFNHERKHKDTESSTKNKLIDWFSELKGIKCQTTLVLEFKKRWL